MRLEGWILLLAACGTPSPAGSAIANKSANALSDCHERERRAVLSRGELGTKAIVDVDDRCSALPIECMDGFDHRDTDGCPDPPPPEIVFPIDSAAMPADANKILDRVAKDARHLANGVRIVVIGDALPREPSKIAKQRADAIVEALLRRCVDRRIIDASTDGLPENYEGRDPPPNRAVILTRGCK